MSIFVEPKCVGTVDAELGARIPIVEDTYYSNGGQLITEYLRDWTLSQRNVVVS